ncbi:unnamed protein product [Pedinophyceae sp. YPF-701]|nr:unnamed protein product [Pedinophyceae sp. YPF-701]
MLRQASRQLRASLSFRGSSSFCSTSSALAKHAEAAAHPELGQAVGPGGKKFRVVLGGKLLAEQPWSPGIAKAVEADKASSVKPLVPSWLILGSVLGCAGGIYGYTIYMLGPGSAGLKSEMERAEEELRAQGVGAKADATQ